MTDARHQFVTPWAGRNAFFDDRQIEVGDRAVEITFRSLRKSASRITSRALGSYLKRLAKIGQSPIEVAFIQIGVSATFPKHQRRRNVRLTGNYEANFGIPASAAIHAGRRRSRDHQASK